MPDDNGNAPDSHPALTGQPAASGSSTVKITAEEFADLQRLRGLEAQIAERQASHAAEIEAAAAKAGEYQSAVAAKEAELTQALASKGEVEKALEEQRLGFERQFGDAAGTISSLKQRVLDECKSATVAAALVGIEFVGDTPETKSKVASRFAAIVADSIEAVDDGKGGVIVREKVSGRPVDATVQDMAKAPDLQGFIAAKTRGGSGTDGTGSTHATVSGNANPHPYASLEWHGWNLERSRVNLTGLIMKP